MNKFKERREIIAEIKKKEITKEEIKGKIVITKNILGILINKAKTGLLLFAGKLKLFQKFLSKYFSETFLNFGKFFKLFLRFYKKCLLDFAKKRSGINNKLYVLFSKNRYGIVGFCFLTLGILNFWNLLSRFKGDGLKSEVEKINFWPTLPFSNILASKKMFELGYYEESQIFYNKAKKLKNNILLGSLNNQEFKEVEKIVLLPQKLEINLSKINLIKEKFPYSWDVNLKKAELEYTLSKKEELENSLALLNWLNPRSYKGFEKEFQNN